RAAGKLDETYRYAFDWEFWCRLALRGDFDRIDNFAPLLFRQRSSGANARLSAKLLWGDQHAAADAAFANPDIQARFPPGELKALRRAFLRNGFWSSARLALTHGRPDRFAVFLAVGLVRYPESVLQVRLIYLFVRSLLAGQRGASG
ncbi:MAG: hypothetical protein AAGL49_11440, partial [Pseudomonadota bacterium]